jgi:N-acetylneuraminic acid mutarotase
LIGDKIYVVGGFSAAGAGANELQIYTPSTDSWVQAGRMPVGMHHPNVAASGGKLYVLGGCDHARKSGPMPNNSPWLGSHHAFEYDPPANRWRALKPLPHSTAAGALIPWGGKLYLIGGVDTNGVVLDLVQEYDPAAETWRERARMPLAREHIGAAALDSLIYVVAGRETGLGGVSVAAFQAYDPARDRWQTLPNLPTARSGLCLAAAKGKLYALGGEWPGTFRLNEEYDPALRSWRAVAGMANARHGFAAVTYRDTVFAMGMVQATEAFLPPGPASAVRRKAKGAHPIRRVLREAGILFLGLRDALGRRPAGALPEP